MVQRIVGRHLRFYGKVRTRMERRRFRGDEPLYLAVCRAFDRVHGLSVELHYLGCAPGTVGWVKLGSGAGDGLAVADFADDFR